MNITWMIGKGVYFTAKQSLEISFNYQIARLVHLSRAHVARDFAPVVAVMPGGFRYLQPNYESKEHEVDDKSI